MCEGSMKIISEHKEYCVVECEKCGWITELYNYIIEAEIKETNKIACWEGEYLS